MKRKVLVLCLAILSVYSLSYGGISGKIIGQVIDADNGMPLIGVNIVLEGSGIGAASDVNGQFIIINIPPGSYDINATMMGYKSHTIQNVRIKVDLSTEVRIEMQPTVLDMNETVVVTAQRPLIQKDLTSSQSIVGSEEIEEMPIEEFEEAVKLTAGVVEGAGGEMHIRGGRSSEIAYLVDGISVTDPYNNTMGVEIENNAIQELQVVSGTFNAEYGQAMSGIVNIVTKEGDFNEYSGNVQFTLGEYYTKDTDIYLEGDEFDITNITEIQGSLDGPLPFFKDRISLFLSGKYAKNDGYLNGLRLYNTDSWVDPDHTNEWYLDTSNLGDSSVVAMNTSKQLSLQSKLSIRLTPSIKLNISGQGSNSWSQGYSHLFFYNPDGRLNYYSNNFNAIFSLNHTLTSRTFYSLKYSYTENSSKSYKYEDPEDPRYNTDPLVFNEFTGYTFYEGGMSMGHSYRTSTINTFKADLSSQITNTHLIKTGAELKFNNIDRLYYSVQVNENTNWIPTVPVYDGGDPSTMIYKNSVNYDEAEHDPFEWSVYLQDKMEFSDMIVNVGIRYEYFNSNGKVLSDPRDPNPYSPMYPQNIFHDYDGDGLQDDDEPLKTDEERLAYWFEDAEPKTQISPRLGISYPITDRGILHFSYGHFLQMPSLAYLYSNPDFEVTSGYNSYIGNANLDPQRTVQFEFGLQQQIGMMVNFDITGFYKDIRNLVSTDAIETYVAGTYYGHYVNYDFGNTKGITFSLSTRRIGLVSGSVDYTFQLAEGNASDPAQRFWDAANGAQSEMQLIYLDWDQRHTLNGVLSFAEKGDWGLTFIANYGSGLPYTPSYEDSDIQTFQNSGRKPYQINVDMKAYKMISVRNMNFTLACKVYNLFDRRNMRYVFSRTGTAAYNIYDVGSGTIIPERYDIRPDYYTTPRLIKLSLGIDIK